MASASPDSGAERDLDDVQDALGSDYEIKSRLGEGAMATVYLGRDRGLGRLVAIKILRPGRARDETARKRFEREARASASLVHPHVVQVYRNGRLPDETPYLVMRYVKGRTMEERIAAEGRLDVATARRALAQVASALAAAHSRGIIHRDVRPANVLWDTERDEALLSDFGIAALQDAGGGDTARLTQTGQMVGDFHYLAPEQLLDQDLTELSDMYAFGITGYELLTGQGPYSAKTNADLIQAHLTKEPADLRALRPDVDPAFADLLRRCLNKEPKRRPGAADVARILQGSESAESNSTAADDGSVDLHAIIKRRVPHIAGGAVVASGIVLQGVDMLVDRGLLPEIAFRLALASVACGFAAAVVVGWFHGARGKQRASMLEWIILGVIAVVWIAIIAWILLL